MIFSFWEEIMSSPINLTPQNNFPITNLPTNTADFYNSKSFAANEIQVLATAISMVQKGFEEGQKQLKDAINGLS